MIENEYIKAIKECIIAISEDLNKTDPLRRSSYSERALEQLTTALSTMNVEE